MDICCRRRQTLLSRLYNGVRASCGDSAAAALVKLTDYLYMMSKANGTEVCTDCKSCDFYKCMKPFITRGSVNFGHNRGFCVLCSKFSKFEIRPTKRYVFTSLSPNQKQALFLADQSTSSRSWQTGKKGLLRFIFALLFTPLPAPAPGK